MKIVILALIVYAGITLVTTKNRIAEAQDVLVRAKREIRDIVWGLKNDDMMRLTPAELLRKLAHEENTKGLYRVDTHLDGLPSKMDAASMRDLSLVVREAIGNAVKHGGAKKIAISVDGPAGGGWRLRISNDGTPFDPASAPGAKEGTESPLTTLPPSTRPMLRLVPPMSIPNVAIPYI